MSTTPEVAAPQRSRKALIGGVVAVLAVGAAGTFAVTQFTADNAGGAESPEALGDAVMESLAQEDVLGVIDLLLPGERDTFREPMISLVSELSRLDVLSDEASLSELQGVDLALDDRQVTVTTTNVSDITNITMTADLTASVDGNQLPIGELITDNLGDDLDLDELSETESGIAFELPVTAVERDGRWYLSGWYTVAENARASEGFGEIPVTGIEPAGGDSPEGALDALLTGVEQLDLTAMIAALNPDEAEALQRYAPLFLAEAQSELDAIGLTWQITDAEYEVDGSGSTRSVAIESLRIDGTYDDGYDVVDFSAEVYTGTSPLTAFTALGNCVKVTAEGGAEDQSFDSCSPEVQAEYEAALGSLPGLVELIDEFTVILEDFEARGITVREVDGQWYVSPVATGFDQLLAFLAALDRDEIQRAIDVVAEFAGGLGGEFGGQFEDDFAFDESLPLETLPPIADLDEAPASTFLTESGETEVSDEQAAIDVEYSRCLGLPTAAEAAACLQASVAAGLLPDYYFPAELEFLECGAGDAYIGIVDIYSLTDAEYTALVTTANECFTRLVAEGRIDEFDVPSDYLRIECAQGRNPWSYEAPDSDEFFDTWLDCLYE